MPVTGRLADIAQKSAVLLLAGTTGKLDITYIYIYLHDDLHNDSLLHGQCWHACQPQNGIEEARKAS